MAVNHKFEVKPLAGNTYELIPTQFLFAVAQSEESAWELARAIDSLVEQFIADEFEKVNNED